MSKNSENSENEEKISREKEEKYRFENIMMSNSVTQEKDGFTVCCFTVIGQIEGHYISKSDEKSTKYEQLIPQLAAVEQDDRIDGVLFILNTVGGDVEAGLAIAELIASMSKPTVSLVLGGGHSIGVPLAVSAQKSFIVPSATMTVHPVRTSGMIINSPQTYSYYERMQDRIIDFVVSHSNIERDTLKKMMLSTEELSNDMGTLLEGKQAVECGLIDCCGGLSEALSYLKNMKKQSIEKE